MKIQINALNIDYPEILSKLTQVKSMQNDDNPYLPLMGKMGALAFLPQNMRDMIVLKVFEQNQSAITERINQSLADNNIEIEIKELLLTGSSDLMKIQLEVDKVNYSQVIVRFLPKIIEQIKKKDNTRVFCDALDIVGDNLEAMVTNLLDNIEDEKKEQLIKLFVNNYSSEILSLLNKLIADNGVTAELSDLIVL